MMDQQEGRRVGENSNVESASSSSHNPTPHPNPRPVRKRTKTGCLTCRKRRIKCGEEKPTCSNCTKSKRTCDGYAKSVVFRHPHPTYHSNPPQRHIYQGIVLQRPTQPLVGAFSRASGNNQVIAPMPEDQRIALNNQHSLPTGYATFLNVHNVLIAPNTYLPPTVIASQQQYVPLEAHVYEQSPPGAHPGPSAYQQTPGFVQSLPTANAVEQWPNDAAQSVNIPSHNPTFQQYGDYVPSAQVPSDHGSSFYSMSVQPLYPPAQSYPTPAFQHSEADQGRIIDSHSFNNQTDINYSQAGMMGTAQNHSHGSIAFAQEAPPAFIEPSQNVLTASLIVDAIVGQNYTQPDTEDEDQPVPERFISERSLETVVALAATHHTPIIRTFTDVLNVPNVLANYIPSEKVSLVDDPEAARIFCHFIKVTGPSLSIFERHPVNPDLMFSGENVPKSHQAIWTYTIPNLALRSQPLMHAVLALGSLHICKLQGTPIDSSLKHYGFALSRVRKVLSNSARRRDVATLAASLLLGYFEVMTADHRKWDSHLSGAKQLILETDYIGMTRRIMQMRADVQARYMYEEFNRPLGANDIVGPLSELDRLLLDEHRNVDEDLIGVLMDRKVEYSDSGDLEDPYERQRPRTHIYTLKDVETYDIQRDLFWWFCKQDAFQSILSGKKLLLPYRLWASCPPRGPVGRLDCICGTADHVVLLLGRIGDFAARDLKRKLKAMEANGGVWRPPGMSAPRRREDSGQASNVPLHQPTPRPPPSGPQFYGMVPSSGPRNAPSAYLRYATVSPASSTSSSSVPDLTSSTLEAEAEWKSILQALQDFAKSLPADYSPLPSSIAPCHDTPFGPSIHYRTHSIAVIWALYYTALIIHQRVHPSMPPASTVATSVAAPKTAIYAILIGRINAGMHPVHSPRQLNPLLGAAMMEGSVPLFFAAVQYVDPAQRNWTITKLKDLTRLTGWQTGRAIASGCELVWVGMGSAGRGPPYRRTIKRPDLDGQDFEDIDPDTDSTGSHVRSRMRLPAEIMSRRVIEVDVDEYVGVWAAGVLSAESDISMRMESMRM